MLQRSFFDEPTEEEKVKRAALERQRMITEQWRQECEVRQIFVWANERGPQWYQQFLEDVKKHRGQKGLDYLLNAIREKACQS